MKPNLALRSLLGFSCLALGCASGAPPASAQASAPPSTTAAKDPAAIADDSVVAADGVKIHFRHAGTGKIALFFVHGWLGNARWWDEQLAQFGPRYKVVAVDLAGHGESGKDRKAWTVPAAAEDLRAVADKLGLTRIVWLGHSMSGSVIVEAANRMPDRTAMLIPVDTLADVAEKHTREEWDSLVAELQKNFVEKSRSMFKSSFAPTSPEPVVRRVLDEAAAAPPASTVPALRSALEFDVATAIRNVKAPIIAINAEQNPPRLQENRKFAPQFDVLLLKDSGHWPMLERPSEFDKLVQQAIDRGTASPPGASSR